MQKLTIEVPSPKFKIGDTVISKKDKMDIVSGLATVRYRYYIHKFDPDKNNSFVSRYHMGHEQNGWFYVIQKQKYADNEHLLIFMEWQLENA